MLQRIWERFGAPGKASLKWAATGIALGVRFWARATHMRVHHCDPAYDPFLRQDAQRAIVVFWHEYAGVLLPCWQRLSITLLISQHRDGELLNELATQMGYRSIRGSTTRGGSAALRQMRQITDSRTMVIAPDGPRGPRRQMALGPIYAASLLRIPIIPVGVGVHSAWRLNTWDRFVFPKPACRVRVIFGAPIHIPRGLDRDAMESCRATLEQTLEATTAVAQSWSEHRCQPPQVRRPSRRLAQGWNVGTCMSAANCEADTTAVNENHGDQSAAA